ncbi:hypothetical protein BDR06DRAFT_967513 [Suillus hirtellus]|nr:hypothetical protein BDR06DRAFT_967513 [Suillus hirtellus]
MYHHLVSLALYLVTNSNIDATSEVYFEARHPLRHATRHQSPMSMLKYLNNLCTFVTEDTGIQTLSGGLEAHSSMANRPSGLQAFIDSKQTKCYPQDTLDPIFQRRSLNTISPPPAPCDPRSSRSNVSTLASILTLSSTALQLDPPPSSMRIGTLSSPALLSSNLLPSSLMCICALPSPTLLLSCSPALLLSHLSIFLPPH